MHKHLTISSTNKQRASIDLIFVLCPPTELTNTSVGPTQYFIAFGPTQSNKYKHFRQFFLELYETAHFSKCIVTDKNAQELDQKCPWDILSTKQTVSPMKCSVTQVSSGSKGEQGEGLGKFTFCQVPTHGASANERGRGVFFQIWKYGTWTKIQSDHEASGFFSSNWQALYCEDHLLGLKMCNDGYWARHPISLLGLGAWDWAGAWGLSGWVILLPTSRESACHLPCQSHC